MYELRRREDTGGGGTGGTGRQPRSTRMVLTFEESPFVPRKDIELNIDKINTEDESLPFYFVESLSSEVNTNETAKPTKLAECKTTQNSSNYLRKKSISANSIDKKRNVCNIYKKNSVHKEISINCYQNKLENKTSNIDWDNMFDTEVFKDIRAPMIVEFEKEKNFCNQDPYVDTVQTNANIVSNQITTENFYVDDKAVLLFEQNKLTSNIHVDNLSESEITHLNEKSLVLKNYQNDIGSSDNIHNTFDKINATKKYIIGIPKLSDSCDNYRETKCTQMVKNWLNSVVSNITEVSRSHTDYAMSGSEEEEEKITLHKHNMETNFSSTNVNTTKCSKKEKNTKKKNVQAQLANKNGIMKFKKPKITTIAEHDINKAEDSIECEKKTLVKAITKNKMKQKFVAPMKAELPLRDIKYNICTVELKNLKETLSAVQHEGHNGITAVLVYTNDFCQLNNHHTDDKCIPDGVMVYTQHNLFYFKGNKTEYKDIFKQLLQFQIICYDGKDLLIYLMSLFELNLYEHGDIYDIKIGAALLEPDNPPDNFSQLQKLLAFTPEYTIFTECVLQKTAWYMNSLRECAFILKRKLLENSLWNVFIEIEMRLLPIISEMERRGVSVDLEKLKSMENILLNKLKKVELLCYTAAGKNFQINSAAQVRAILYDQLELDKKCNIEIRETITRGAKSTSETMLRSLMSAHPLPKLILEYRHLHKAHATCLAGVACHVKDGLVKPTWVQTGAATGRIASNNPNLQAIPKAPFTLALFPEANNNSNEALNLRSVYTAREGYTLLAADFKHIECRIFAHVAGDSTLLDALDSQDLFKVLAAKWLNKSEKEISNEERERTKRIVYASLYGAGTRKLMDILDVSYERALNINSSFNRTFPSLKSFGRYVWSHCAAAGGRLGTATGRTRRFDHIGSADFALRSHAQRQAVNFVLQGSAADLCKRAMVSVATQLRSHWPPVEGHLLLQIHDELVWEVWTPHLHAAADVVRSAMPASGLACGLPAPLPVSLCAGRSWGELQPLQHLASEEPTYQ